MNNTIHIPVLCREAVEMMNLHEGDEVVDGTFGAGGHSREILKIIGKTGKLIGIDRDRSILEKVQKDFKNLKNVFLVNDKFSNLDLIIKNHGFNHLKAILLDLGFSSWQLVDEGRGFSYDVEGDLDMRMGVSDLTAAQILNEYNEEQLFKIFRDYGEIERPGNIVKLVISSRRALIYQKTSDLRKVLEDSGITQKSGRNLWARIWQALRMEVNGELEELASALEKGLNCLESGGRLAVISFHSLEDKKVKSFFKEKSISCVCPKEFPKCMCGKKAELKIVNRKAIVAGEKELLNNYKSHSAKLRVAEKI